MKKLLLFAIALNSTLAGFSQNAAKPQPSGRFNMADKVAYKFRKESAPSSSAAKASINGDKAVVSPAGETAQNSVSNPPSSISWKLLCGSMNVYGQLESRSRPLQYNPNVKAVSYIHRKSESYTATPVQNAGVVSGVIVAEISSDWGVTWDSTCIWNDAANAGRYPQGAIYSAMGNTNIANAYVVGSGPALTGNNFAGNWYASKKLAVPGSTLYNNTADATLNAQQYLSSVLPSYPANQGPHGWSRYGFSSTDDGLVRSLALIEDDDNDLITMRGVSVVKGTYAGGIFNWTTDSLAPVCIVSAGTKVLSSEVQMAWNQTGDVGYVLMTGAISTATGANKGYQPIVYKTTNFGGTWVQVPSIDFNSPAMQGVVSRLASVPANPTLSIPYFYHYDIAVDADNKLHIGAIIASTASNHNDSLNNIAQFSISINPSDNYFWKHTPGFRPYLYDFIGDGLAPWTVKTVDSLSTEDPGFDPSYTGYTMNPWDVDAGTKISVDPRLQMGRTPDGKFITFSFSESDTNFIVGSKKYNVLPNIKARCMSVSNGSYVTSSSEINVSRPAVGQGTINPKVSDKAFLHYMSPTSGAQTTFTSPTSYTVDFNLPFTVTNSAPLGQLTNNITWYAASKLSFAFNGSAPTPTDIGMPENNLNSAAESILFPNPANNTASLLIKLKDNADVTISVYNIVGQLLQTVKAEGKIGENNIALDLNKLSSGIYMVNVKAGDEMSTKKLVVE